MTKELKQFILNNKDLINQNTKESWEKIYKKLPSNVTGKFTQIILDTGINDPAEIMGYIPFNYLFNSNISKYVIPNNVTSIGDCAFQECDSLTDIIIPDNVTSIGYEAFTGCSSLTNIEIPHSVTSIDEDAFGYCNSLTKVNYTGTIDEWAQIDFGDAYSNPLLYAKNLYINNQLVTKVVLKNTTKINAYVFLNCKNLTNVTIDNNIKSVGYYAFNNCSSLTEINYLGTKNEAMEIGIGFNYMTRWRDDSNISKIICTDGVIDL